MEPLFSMCIMYVTSVARLINNNYIVAPYLINKTGQITYILLCIMFLCYINHGNDMHCVCVHL